MRLFVAVDFDDAVREAIAAAIDAFPVRRVPWRWSAPETWHLTLRFIGERPERDVERLEEALAAVARRHEPFDLTLGRFGAFPSLRRARVLFWGVERGADELERLARDVSRAVEAALGLDPDPKPFRAHATVARLRWPPDAELLARLERVPPLDSAAQRVDAFGLVHSRLGPGGARHRRLKRFALGGAGC